MVQKMHSVNYGISFSTKMLISALGSNIHSPLVNHERDCCSEQVQGESCMYKVEIVRVCRVSRKVRVTEQ